MGLGHDRHHGTVNVRQHINRKIDHDVATVNHQEYGCGNNQEPILKRETDDGV